MVDSVLKYVNLSMIWQRKISPLVVLYMAIPTQLEQYSMMLMICSLMFCFLPVVLTTLFLSIDRFVWFKFHSFPLSSVKRQLTLILFIERPVFGMNDTEGFEVWLIGVLDYFSSEVFELRLLEISLLLNDTESSDFFQGGIFLCGFFICLNCINSSSSLNSSLIYDSTSLFFSTMPPQ